MSLTLSQKHTSDKPLSIYEEGILHTSPFGKVGKALFNADQAFLPIPIDPYGKAPSGGGRVAARDFYHNTAERDVLAGEFVTTGLNGWQSLTRDDIEQRLDHWAGHFASLGVGVRHSSELIGFDFDIIDQPELQQKLLDLFDDIDGIAVIRKGSKGFLQYFRCKGDVPTHVISLDATKGNSGNIDILGAGRQSVLPPSIHPSGVRYQYLPDSEALQDVELHDLPLLSQDLLADVREIMGKFGVVTLGKGSSGAADGSTGKFDGEYYRHLDREAIQQLESWVHDLDLARLESTEDGYACVPYWRSSGQNRPLNERKLSLRIKSGDVIRDRSTGDLLTPIGLISQQLDIDKAAAKVWLADKLGIADLGEWERAQDAIANVKFVTEPERMNGSEAEKELADIAADAFTTAGAEIRQYREELSIAVMAYKETLINMTPPEFMLKNLETGEEVEERITSWRRARWKRHFMSIQKLWDVESKRPAARAYEIEAGAGKTQQFGIEQVIEAAKRNETVVVAVPEHEKAGELRDDIVSRAADLGYGIDVRVWMGQNQEGMCLRPDDAKEVRDAQMSVQSTLCTSMAGGFSTVICPMAEECQWQKQVKMQPSVWVVTHASLQHMRGALYADSVEVDHLVIDESIVKNAAPSQRESVSIPVSRLGGDVPDDMLMNGESLRTQPAPAAILLFWSDFQVAVEKTFADGFGYASYGLLRKHLEAMGWDLFRRSEDDYGGTIEGVLGWHEGVMINRTVDGAQVGGSLKEQLRIARKFQPHKDRITILKELTKFLSDLGDKKASGRLTVRMPVSEEKEIRFECATMRQVHSSWKSSAAIYLLDATLADPEAISLVLGGEVRIEQKLAVRWSEDIKTVVVRGAPSKTGQLGLMNPRDNDGEKKNFNMVRDFAYFTASQAQAWGLDNSDVLFIPKKEMGERISLEQTVMEANGKPRDMPVNLLMESPGKIVGRNDWAHCAGLIITASADAGPEAFERQVAVLTGDMPERLSSGDGSRSWWWSESVGKELRDGSVALMTNNIHPDPMVQALYDHVVLGALVQFAARVRPTRRDGEPGFILIATDQALPLPVDQVLDWADVDLDKVARCLTNGMLGTNRVDLQKMHPNLWDSENAAGLWVNRVMPQFFSANGMRGIRTDNRLDWGWDYEGFSGDAGCQNLMGDYYIYNREKTSCVPEKGSPSIIGPKPQNAKLVKIQYRKDGSDNRETAYFFSHHQCAKNPQRWLEGELGCKVQVFASEGSCEQGVIYTTPKMTFAAYPQEHSSFEACKKQLQRRPVAKQVGWADYNLKLAGKGQKVGVVYLDGLTRDQAITIIEKDQGKRVVLLEPLSVN